VNKHELLSNTSLCIKPSATCLPSVSLSHKISKTLSVSCNGRNTDQSLMAGLYSAQAQAFSQRIRCKSVDVFLADNPNQLAFVVNED
jgi:hypothetical protein